MMVDMQAAELYHMCHPLTKTVRDSSATENVSVSRLCMPFQARPPVSHQS